MDSDLYKKLVDLYGGRELTEELEGEMGRHAFRDPELNHEMTTLRRTVDLLQASPEPDFTEESYQRILMKIYARGGEIQPRRDAPAHMQFHLPIQV